MPLFYGNAKFDNLSFFIGKWENSGYIWNHCTQWPEILHTNSVNKSEN